MRSPQKAKPGPKVSLEEFLVDLYVKIDGKIWEQDGQFTLVKKSLVDNILHRPGQMLAPIRKELARALNACPNESSLRECVAKYVDVQRTVRVLTLSQQGEDLVAISRAISSEAFRVGCSDVVARGWKVGDLERFLVTAKLLGGTYVFSLDNFRAGPDIGINDVSSITIKEVVSSCPRPGGSQSVSSTPRQARDSKRISFDKSATILAGCKAVVFNGDIDKRTSTGLPEPPAAEQGTGVAKLEAADIIAMLRQCVRSFEGYEKVLHAIDSSSQFDVLDKFVQQDQCSSSGSSALAHVFTIEPAIVPSIHKELTTISNKLASQARQRFAEKIAGIPSTQDLMKENHAGRREQLLNSVSEELDYRIKRALSFGRRDRTACLKWCLVSNARMRIACDAVHDGDIFVLCEGYMQVRDGLKGRVRGPQQYQVPAECLRRGTFQRPPENAPTSVTVDHEATMNFALHLEMKVLSVNGRAIEDSINGALDLPVNDFMSFLKKTSSESRKLERIR